MEVANDEKYLKREGEIEIDWLSNEQRAILAFSERVSSYTGMWQNMRSRFWVWFWTIIHICWVAEYIYSVPFLIKNLDLFAHLIHHMVIACDDLIYIHVLSIRKKCVKSLYEGVTKTYNYNSESVRNYHRKLLSARIATQDVPMSKLMMASAATVTIYLQVFFILEATLLKNYETGMFPVHFPFDIHHPATYTAVVIMQNLTVGLSLMMIWGNSILLYTAYCHLELEYNVLIYVVKHLNDLASEEGSADKYNFYCYHIAKHHACIRRYFYEAKKAFEFLVTAVIFTGLICFACVGITLLSDNLGIKLKFVIIMAVQLFVIYSWCWVGEELASKEAELREELAGVSWWLMPKKCHSTILLMLVGCQIPIIMTTPFNQEVTRQGFKDMITSSYSCFNLMYQMNF